MTYTHYARPESGSAAARYNHGYAMAKEALRKPPVRCMMNILDRQELANQTLIGITEVSDRAWITRGVMIFVVDDD